VVSRSLGEFPDIVELFVAASHFLPTLLVRAIELRAKQASTIRSGKCGFWITRYTSGHRPASGCPRQLFGSTRQTYRSRHGHLIRSRHAGVRAGRADLIVSVLVNTISGPRILRLKYVFLFF
jgi:hypothetical protein